MKWPRRATICPANFQENRTQSLVVVELFEAGPLGGGFIAEVNFAEITARPSHDGIASRGCSAVLFAPNALTRPFALG